MLMRLRIVLLCLNSIAFGACLVLLATSRSVSGPLVLLTIGSGLSAAAGFANLLMRARRQELESSRPH